MAAVKTVPLVSFNSQFHIPSVNALSLRVSVVQQDSESQNVIALIVR